uniref:SUN domain-containing protein n=1 Tax=Caenorhabditis japonica TaxID=281687 RepID=A0A8R1EFL5_CAEJA
LTISNAWTNKSGYNEHHEVGMVFCSTPRIAHLSHQSRRHPGQKDFIGNFELFASRPKTIHVFISERYPPLANWISLGSFQLQDHHKHLQTFDVPNTNVYAKYVRINLEDHYGKEHYCIVSVVNVMGSTLADEYDKEEAAAQMMNVIEETKEELKKKKEEPVTTPPPSEQKMQTQLPVPPRAVIQTGIKEKGF